MRDNAPKLEDFDLEVTTTKQPRTPLDPEQQPTIKRPQLKATTSFGPFKSPTEVLLSPSKPGAHLGLAKKMDSL
jgi:hypothetical protein